MQTHVHSERRGDLVLVLDVLAQPAKAFRYLSRHSHIGLALLVYVLSHLPASLAPPWLPGGGSIGAATPALAAVARDIVANLAELLVGALLLHVAATIVGGRNGYGKILQAEAFSALPLLLTAPFAALAHLIGAPALFGVPLVAAVAWSVGLTVIGIRETYRFTTGRALLAFGLTVGFLLIIYVAFVLAFGLFMLPG